MKTLLLILLTMTTLHAQHITENLESYQKKYHNIFTQAGSRLNMDFVTEYDLATPQESTYKFIISIDEYDTEEVSTTYSGFFAGGILGGGLSGTYEKNDYGGSVALTPEKMNDIYHCANSVFSYVNSRASITDQHINPSVASCSTSGITLSGEYTGSTTWYYFGAGDATFRMDQEQFIEIMKVLRKSIKRIDDSRSP